jgi:hypothetical protein
MNILDCSSNPIENYSNLKSIEHLITDSNYNYEDYYTSDCDDN